MSRRVLEGVIGTAILDEEFRLMLFADPEAALGGYELTTDELAALKSVGANCLDGCEQSIERRVVSALRKAGVRDVPLCSMQNPSS
jgi:hypothetical protein